ncbi:hypothetical protein, partial [Plesiomonas shigelloides]
KIVEIFIIKNNHYYRSGAITMLFKALPRFTSVVSTTVVIKKVQSVVIGGESITTVLKSVVIDLCPNTTLIKSVVICICPNTTLVTTSKLYQELTISCWALRNYFAF